MAPCNSAVAFSVAIFYTAWAATSQCSLDRCKVSEAQEVSEAHGAQLFQWHTQEGGSESRASLTPQLKQQLVEVMETAPCVWGHPHNVQNRDDKPLCEDGVFTWSCKSGGHGGRLQCPGQVPIMCDDTSCDGGTDYCCEKDCGEAGPRLADVCSPPLVPDGGCAPSVAVDIIFLVDSSGSISQDGFDQSRHYLKEVVKRLPVDGSNVSTHVGLAQFSTKSFESVEIDLLEGTTREAVNAALDKMEWHKLHYKMDDPMTHTGEAIQYVLDHMFPKARDNSTEMLVIITDGQSNGITDPANISAVAREDGIEVVAVGIRNYGDDEEKKQQMESELTGIVGDKGKLLTVDTYSELVTIVENTSHMVCTYAEPTPKPTPLPTAMPTPPPTPEPPTPEPTPLPTVMPTPPPTPEPTPKPTPLPTVMPTPPPTPQPTGPCLWASAHNMPDRQEPLCEDGAFAWDCVGGGHGHRLQCSSSHPVMCNGMTCGSPSGKNYCCEAQASDCDGLGGVRESNDCPVHDPPVPGCNASVPLDLIFLLDSSGSIGKKGFDQSRMFLKKVAKHLPLDQGNVSTQVAIVQFSDVGKESVEIPLADGITFDRVEDAVNAMTWHGTITHDPMTHTGEAIEYVMDHVFPASVAGFSHMLAIITDGKANGEKDPAAMAAKAREKGIEIVAIGVAEYDKDELMSVTGDKSKVLTVKSHSDLLSIVNATAEVVCNNAVAHSTS